MSIHGLPFSSKSISREREMPIIAVTMATSRQGRAVIKYLSKTGNFRLRAITRTPSSQMARQLSKFRNVEVVRGDLIDKESLQKCFKGAYGIFGNTTPTKGWVPLRGSMIKKYELEQGRNLVEAVEQTYKEGSLEHFIFSSVCKAKDPLKSEPAPGHFSTKWCLEEFINLKGLKSLSTILRPVSYFENFDSDLPGIAISNHIFPGIIKSNAIWQTIAVDDVGQWATAVFKNPNRFLGNSLNIAGEELTGNEMAELLSQVTWGSKGKAKYTMVPRQIMNLIEHDIALMAEWIERAGYGANIEENKALANEFGIKITSLLSWLKVRKSASFYNSEWQQNRSIDQTLEVRTS